MIMVACSGGMKSALMIEYAKREKKKVLLAYIRRRIPAERKELRCVHELAAHHGLDLIIRELPARERNVMLGPLLYWYLLYIAEMYKCRELWIGVSAEDTGPEAEEGFFRLMSAMLEKVQPMYDEFGLFRGDRLDIQTPLLQLTHEQVVILGEKFGVPWTLTTSCLRGGRFDCGECEGCARRRTAFFFAEVEDPTLYAKTSN